MIANKSIDQFNQRLDQLLGLGPRQIITTAYTSHETESAIQTAGLLIGMNLEADAAPRPDLRERWQRQARRLTKDRSSRARISPRLAWIAVLVIVLSLLIVFHQPVFAAVGRLFGYVYIPNYGFLPMESTYVIQQPVVQEHDGRSVTVTQGVTTPAGTYLTLAFSDTARPGDGAWLDLDTGARLSIKSWQYSPDSPGSHGLTLTFPSLPSGVKQTTLALPEGWRLPLIWLPAAQAQVLQVGVIPYPNPTQAQTPVALCQENHGIQLCVLAATASSDQTTVLIQGKTVQGDLKPGAPMFGLVSPINGESVTLEAPSGSQVLTGAAASSIGIDLTTLQQQVVFPALPAGEKTVRLTIPSMIANVDINQSITVDMGADPQPGQTVPVNADLQVLGTTVRFRKATFVGDGVSSLRLTLDAEPVETVDGVTPLYFELGRPAGVDDLYGGGTLGGGKALFVELFQSGRKLTGILKLPIVQAVVSLHGPFVFDFTISQSVPAIPTPVVANPADFTPEPSSTPIPLDSYSYSGLPLDPGDLLYTVINGDKTDVYEYLPGQLGQSQWFATLPGAVYQIYIHPDRHGLDYLAGTQIKDTSALTPSYYYRGIQLYTLAFGEKTPGLLYAFPWGSDNFTGTQVTPSWSFDGRYLLFSAFGFDTQPGSNVFRFGWFDMSCRSNGTCVPHYLQIPSKYQLYNPLFSPNDYRILFTGADTSLQGIGDIFLMQFDPNTPESPIVNLTHSTHIDHGGGSGGAVWFPDGRILSYCHDFDTDPTAASGFFCTYDSQTGASSYAPTMQEILDQYQASPSNQTILATVLISQGPEAGNSDLRLFEVNGQAGPILANKKTFDEITTSPTDQYVAFIADGGQQLTIVETSTTQRIDLYTSDGKGVASWIGWVR